ncbi:MAG: hypothetical protein Q9174_002885, partial [Haloplaca sp. 1 TL-2023]
MEYLTCMGLSALSDFRQQELISKLDIDDISARYVHFIALQDRRGREILSDAQRAQLDQLLPSRPGSEGTENDEHQRTAFVYPRQGISPWSSKASSIAEVCGLGGAIKRIERGIVYRITCKSRYDTTLAAKLLHDPMTETFSDHLPDLETMFAEGDPAPLHTVNLDTEGVTPHEALQAINKELGLALDGSEIDYLVNSYAKGGPLARSPTDVELFMFAQINSEHCRHKQFNASWTIDGEPKPHSLFDMIRTTHRTYPKWVVSAYSDNAAVLEGPEGSLWAPSASGEWTQIKEQVHYLIKVETHNHPTAVSPFPGAATGSGGEIRDEGAVGRGSKPKAGLCGFAVSDLLIPGYQQPWETDLGKPNHITSSFDIMIDAPLGSSAFNNEFGRPCLTGFFRTLLVDIPVQDKVSEMRGYHKPIMIAGGVGSVRPQHALKDPHLVPPGAPIIVMGGPAMLIGLGGGAASSQASTEGAKELDFASVQRGNPEVQIRAQEVISACTALGRENPILFIHDVGAGGLSNALPELVHDCNLGATFELRDIDNADRAMSPLQIWCCEAQERYVLAVAPDKLNAFRAMADKQRCSYSVVGKTQGEGDGEKRLTLMDRESKEHPKPIDLPMAVLFGKPPKLSRTVETRKLDLPVFDSTLETYLPKLSGKSVINEAVRRVLQLPCVGSKSFLITIGDRSVGGLVTRDQMVGRHQVPVADVAVTATSLTLGIKTGEAMAMGEKPTLALISPASSARMAIAESLMNIAAADVMDGLERIRLSANWMSSINSPGEGAALYEGVEAARDLCVDLGISIPVGKDSTSMKMSWKDQEPGEDKEVTAPMSLVVSAFTAVKNLHRTWTPALRRVEDVGETVLLMVDLSEGHKALGGSALAQVFNQTGNESPDVRNNQFLKDYFDAMDQLQEAGIVLAYHDISDGGLLTSLAEMMFAGRCGLYVMLDYLCSTAGTSDLVSTLFNEELGAVFQVRKRDETNFRRCFATCGPPTGLIKKIGSVAPAGQHELVIYHKEDLVYRESRVNLQRLWSGTSHQLQRRRDNPACADEEYAGIADLDDPGLSYRLPHTFNPAESILPLRTKISSRLSQKPRVAILREQGTNGQAEMAFAFSTAGFAAVDVHMTDLMSGRISLSTFVGLAACGGFSHGDVLGAGRGWACSVLQHPGVRKEFETFFARKDTFTLGVCNGCQFLSHVKELIPGTKAWPSFQRNKSESYEARFTMVRVSSSPSSRHPNVFLHSMHDSCIPIVSAHGEGRAVFSNPSSLDSLRQQDQIALQYVDNATLAPTERYPANPNGSPEGVCGVSSTDGRVLAMMPHPERTILGGTGSWAPAGMAEEWGEVGVWARLFQSARRWNLIGKVAPDTVAELQTLIRLPRPRTGIRHSRIESYHFCDNLAAQLLDRVEKSFGMPTKVREKDRDRDRERDKDKERLRDRDSDAVRSKEKVRHRSSKSNRKSSSKDAEKSPTRPERSATITTPPDIRKNSLPKTELERRSSSNPSTPHGSKTSLPYPSFSKAHSKEAIGSREDVVNARLSYYTPDPTDLEKRNEKQAQQEVPINTGAPPPSPPLTTDPVAPESISRERSPHNVRPRKTERKKTDLQKAADELKRKLGRGGSLVNEREEKVRSPSSRSRRGDREVAGDGDGSTMSKERSKPGTPSKSRLKVVTVEDAASTSSLQRSTSPPASNLKYADAPTESTTDSDATSVAPNQPATQAPTPQPDNISTLSDESPKTPTLADPHYIPSRRETPAYEINGNSYHQSVEESPMPPPPPPPPAVPFQMPKVDYLMLNGGLQQAVPKSLLAAGQPVPPNGHPLPTIPTQVDRFFGPFNTLLDDYVKVMNKSGSLAVATGYRSIARKLLDRLEAVFNRDISSETCTCIICQASPLQYTDEDSGVSWGEILEYVCGRQDLPQWPPFVLDSSQTGLGISEGMKQHLPMQNLDVDVPEEYRDHYVRQSKKTK